MNIAQPFVLSRQSCTDKEWGAASGCKDICSSGELPLLNCSLVAKTKNQSS